MPADILSYADALLPILQGAFDAVLATTTVERAYEISFDVGTFDGLKVVVMPVEYARAAQASRDADYFDCGCVVVVAERFAGDEARPPVSWVDARVNLVEACVFDPLREIGESDADLLLDLYWCESVEVTTVYDAPFLREHGAFWSEVEVMFRKLRDAS